MNFLQLEYFVTLVRQGSLSQAAKALGISQSALSLSYSKLEKEFGYPLIEYHKRQLRLTTYGKIFYDFCLTILNELDNIQYEFQEMRNIYEEKRVIIGISDNHYYADWLTDIYDIYPDMCLHILQMSKEEIQERLAKCQIDFGIISGTQIRPAPNRRLLSSQPFELLVLASHPLANQFTIEASQLSKIPLVSLSPNFAANRMVDILSAELGFKPDIVFEGNQSIMTAMFHNGAGSIITCAHDKSQYMLQAPENYRSLEIIGTYSRYEFFLQWPERRYITKYNQLFRDFVLNYYHLL